MAQLLTFASLSVSLSRVFSFCLAVRVQCYRCGNIASILIFDENMDRSLKIFREVPESGKAQSQKAGVQYFY